MENVTKRFGKVVANNAINLELREGEILSLLGENGSGKTTLMNMLSGIYFPDEGQIYIHGKPVTIASPKDAFNYGIGMIHQHFKLVDVFTATENIVLGLEGKLDLTEAGKKVKEIAVTPTSQHKVTIEYRIEHQSGALAGLNMREENVAAQSAR